jgi:hypothetical protein
MSPQVATLRLVDATNTLTMHRNRQLCYSTYGEFHHFQQDKNWLETLGKAIDVLRMEGSKTAPEIWDLCCFEPRVVQLRDGTKVWPIKDRGWPSGVIAWLLNHGHPLNRRKRVRQAIVGGS